MHIKDHSAAMKFFRTYDNVASKGKWKDFVDEMGICFGNLDFGMK